MNALGQAREEAYRVRVLEALRRAVWDVTAAAVDLGVHRTYLHRLITRFALQRPLRVVGTGDNAGKRVVVELLSVGKRAVVVRLPNGGGELRLDRTTGEPIESAAFWRLDRTTPVPADAPIVRRKAAS